MLDLFTIPNRYPPLGLANGKPLNRYEYYTFLICQKNVFSASFLFPFRASFFFCFTRLVGFISA